MGKPNYIKLRTNLRLAINRLKLLEKKKAEMALKSRREIADYIGNGKDDRARIRVEHIIREDYMVEGMEIVEMFCDLLLARFGLVERMKEMDPGLEEAIATILWTSPRLSTDIQEMKEISKQLIAKYGKEYNDMCVKNGLENVNEKVIIKMGLHAPPKLLIENYMIEIAKSYNVAFTPDPAIMMGENDNAANDLIELGIPSEPGIGFEDLLNPDRKDPRGPGGGSFGGGSGGGGGGGMTVNPNGYADPPPFQPGSSGFYPGESAPPYEAQAGASGFNAGAGGGPPSPGNRLPPPLPSNPPNSAGSSPAGKGAEGNTNEEDLTYDYALAPGQARPPSYSMINKNIEHSAGVGPTGFSNNLYDNRDDATIYSDVITSHQVPPPASATTFQGYPGAGGGTTSGPGPYPTNQPPGPNMGSGNGGGVAPAARISTGDSIYVPVLPDVPNLPGENVQSGKHNTDYAPTGYQYPPPPGAPGNNGHFAGGVPVLPDIPSAMFDLPDVPSDSVRTNTGNDNDVDFDDLTKRFEALKKKK